MRLAEMIVRQLAATPGNRFDSQTALDSSVTRTRGIVAARGCCTVSTTESPGAFGPLYLGQDKEGYVIVSPHRDQGSALQWPRLQRRLKPVRLSRWLLNAAEGAVVRHMCDNPRCIKIAHLRVGSQADNLKDCLRRKRRRAGGLGASPSRPPCTRSTVYDVD